MNIKKDQVEKNYLSGWCSSKFYEGCADSQSLSKI